MAQSETVQQPFKYAGQVGVFDEGSNLYYMRARYYDASIGRFISEDPIGFQGGLNLYAYVGGNPIMAVDTSGFEASSIANSALSNGNLNLFEANAIWRANTDPGLVLTVDATKLTVRQSRNFGSTGTAPGVVDGAADWLVHGSVTLNRDQQGNITIAPGLYNFEPHGNFWDHPIRNFETYGGFYVGSHGGISVGTDYLIKYSGAPNVSR